jgi:hypothetical protein
MGSNPIIGTLEDALLPGKIAQIRDLIGCERSRTKTHAITVYLPTIRQVIYAKTASGGESTLAPDTPA